MRDIVKDYFGFGKDGQNVNGNIMPLELREKNLDSFDKMYIHEMDTKLIRARGKRLDKKRFLCFEGERQPKEKRAYLYRGKYYNIYELSTISGISPQTIYQRINIRAWSIKQSVETNLIRKGTY